MTLFNEKGLTGACQNVPLGHTAIFFPSCLYIPLENPRFVQCWQWKGLNRPIVECNTLADLNYSTCFILNTSNTHRKMPDTFWNRALWQGLPGSLFRPGRLASQWTKVSFEGYSGISNVLEELKQFECDRETVSQGCTQTTSLRRGHLILAPCTPSLFHASSSLSYDSFFFFS